MTLRGSTHNHRLVYDYITHIHLLPHGEEGHYLIISLDPPLRHGMTRYPHVLIKFTREHEATHDITVSFPTEEVQQSLSSLADKRALCVCVCLCVVRACVLCGVCVCVYTCVLRTFASHALTCATLLLNACACV